ncbi:MAG: hypothetical protein HFJ50_00880 [Clostridia bacterium]|jgi:magnesium-transporting ATPase (P-type)|nr:hypothetical protein [Clostridia bacterium]
MKKAIVFALVLIVCFCIFCANAVYGAEEILNSDTTSKMIEMSEQQKDELEDYKEKYGSDAYGFTAFILNKVRIFSIPFCFLGIVISAIYQYVIGIRKLDVKYRGFYTMIAFITLFVIAQVLPLVFVIVIKGFGRS